MPGTFTAPDMVDVKHAEAVADYVAVGTLATALALNDDYKIQLTYALTFGISTTKTTYHLLGIAAAVDFTAGANIPKHFYQWVKVLAWPACVAQAAGGQRVAISSDATPTAVQCELRAVVAAGGSGYSVGNDLTLTGGTKTQSGIFTVTAVGGGGAVTAVTPKAATRGVYTVVPANPVATTGGGDDLCTLTVTWVYSITNTKLWFVGGPDTVVVDGWVCYVVEVVGTPDLLCGTPVMSAIIRMGLGTTPAAATKVATHAIDRSHYGTGLTCIAGTFAPDAPVTMEDFRLWDNANARAYGVVISQSGIYYLAGKLNIGTTGQEVITRFKDTSQVYVWQGFPVNTGFYEIKLAGAGGLVTTFQLGTYADGLASGGVVIRGANRYTHYGGVATGLVPAIWTLTAGAANTWCLLYGCTFSELLSATFKSDSEIRFCKFQNFASITPAGAVLADCVFQDVRTTSPISGTYALLVSAKADLDNMIRCSFINCNKAIRISTLIDSGSLRLDVDAGAGTYTRLAGDFTANGFVAGQRFLASGFANGGNNVEKEIQSVTALVITVTDATGLITETGSGDERVRSGGKYSFSGIKFSGNAYDIENNSTAPVVINVVADTGGDTPTYLNTGAGSTTTVNNPVAVKVKIVDKNNVGLNGIRVYMEYQDDRAVLINALTANVDGVDGIVTAIYNGSLPRPVTIYARKSPAGGTRYLPLSTTGSITTSGFSLTATIYIDSFI